MAASILRESQQDDSFDGSQSGGQVDSTNLENHSFHCRSFLFRILGEIMDRIDQVKSDLQQLKELLGVKPEDISSLDPSLQQLRRADLLVKTPLPDPLTAVIEGEAYDIAKLEILVEIFTLHIPTSDLDTIRRIRAKPKPGEDYIHIGGLPATSAGVSRIVNILPAIDGKRAGQFVDAIKPAQPNIPVEMPREEKEGIFDKVRQMLFGRTKAEQNRYQGDR